VAYEVEAVRCGGRHKKTWQELDLKSLPLDKFDAVRNGRN